MAKPKTTEPFSVAPLESYSTSLVDLTARERSIKSRQLELEVEWAELLSRPRQEAQDGRVAAILGDDVEDGADVDTNRQQLAALSQERNDLVRALDIIRGRIAVEKTQASRLAWKDVNSVHRDAVRATCLALAAANQAWRQLHDIREAINGAGLSWLDHPHFTATRLLGNPLDTSNPVDHLLAQAVIDGFVEAREVAYA